MKIFNLKVVGHKITVPFIKLFNIVLNKIAINSNLYKALYNEVELNKNTYEKIKEFREIVTNSSTAQLLTDLYKTISPGVLEKFDYKIINSSEYNDIIVVSSQIEKQKVIQSMSISSGAGQVFTIEEVLAKFYDLPIDCKIYIFSSVWIKEQTKLINLLYKINTDIERYKI